MRRERKRYTAEFKARVALEAGKEQKTLNELGAQFGVHPTQIVQWKKQLMAHVPDVFARGCARRRFRERPVPTDWPVADGTGVAQKRGWNGGTLR